MVVVTYGISIPLIPSHTRGHCSGLSQSTLGGHESMVGYLQRLLFAWQLGPPGLASWLAWVSVPGATLPSHGIPYEYNTYS